MHHGSASKMQKIWNLASCIQTSGHGGDMPYTFDIPDANFTSTGRTVASQHIQYWSNFARSFGQNMTLKID